MKTERIWNENEHTWKNPFCIPGVWCKWIKYLITKSDQRNGWGKKQAYWNNRINSFEIQGNKAGTWFAFSKWNQSQGNVISNKLQKSRDENSPDKTYTWYMELCQGVYGGGSWIWISQQKKDEEAVGVIGLYDFYIKGNRRKI